MILIRLELQEYATCHTHQHLMLYKKPITNAPEIQIDCSIIFPLAQMPNTHNTYQVKSQCSSTYMKEDN